MVRISLGGSYLKAKEAEKGVTITIKDEGKFETSDTYFYDEAKTQPKVSFVMTVEYKGEDKLLRVNKASKVSMVETFGDDSKDWVGKKAKLIIMPTPNGDNKMIVLDPVIGNSKDLKESDVFDDEKAWDSDV